MSCPLPPGLISTPRRAPRRVTPTFAAIWRLQKPAPPRFPIARTEFISPLPFPSPNAMPLASTCPPTEEAHPHTMQLDTNPGPATQACSLARLHHAPVPSPIRDQDAAMDTRRVAHLVQPATWSPQPATWSRRRACPIPSPICTCTLMARCPCPPQRRDPFHNLHTLLAHTKTAASRQASLAPLFITPWLHGDCSPCSTPPTSPSPPSLSVPSLFGILHSTVILAARGMSRE